MTELAQDGVLCEQCRSIFTKATCNVLDQVRNTIESYVRADALPDLPNLQKEALVGCPLCADLRQRILLQYWPDGSKDITIGPATLIHESWSWSSHSDLTPKQEGIWMLDVTVQASGSAETANLHYDLFSAHKSSAKEKLRIRRRRPFRDRAGTECVEQIQQWIKKCSTRHSTCISHDESFWPTRLMDVGPADSSVHPRLILTSGPAEKYVALSHCWGKSGPGIRSLRTISSTIDDYMAGIPLTSMPLNYQHAVIMTRALGLRYLWIDSLCILQDSVSDWAAEGAQMDNIYKRAWVTLAATSASNSEGGFLEHPMEDRMIAMKTGGQLVESDHTDTVAGATIFARHMAKRDNIGIEFDVDLSAWNHRGWTLQERHLARRIIHFGKSQIFWECRRNLKSECGQLVTLFPFSITRNLVDTSNEFYSESEASSTDGSDLSDAEQSEGPDIESSPNPFDGVDATEAKTSVYSWWFQILADYCPRSLTYASDKLPAISGLAKELNGTLFQTTGHHDDYLAGIWIGALVDCLLWKSNDPDTMTSPEVYRAPSWSWARWDGDMVSTANRPPILQEESHLIEYVAHKLVLIDDVNPYGQVREVSMQIKGAVSPIRLEEAWNREKIGERYHMCTVDGTRIGLVYTDGPAAILGPVDGDVFAMQVTVQKKREYEAVVNYSGLVLRALEASETFERIGIFTLDEGHFDAFQLVEKSVITLV